MNKFPLLLLTISLCIFTISLEEYTIEPITELVPKNFVFDGYNTNTFKIYHYIPSCEDKDKKNKIFFQVSKSDSVTYRNSEILYLYEDHLEINKMRIQTLLIIKKFIKALIGKKKLV